MILAELAEIKALKATQTGQDSESIQKIADADADLLKAKQELENAENDKIMLEQQIVDKRALFEQESSEHDQEVKQMGELEAQLAELNAQFEETKAIHDSKQEQMRATQMVVDTMEKESEDIQHEILLVDEKLNVNGPQELSAA